ncbi:MAG TPA: hypothetical protein VIJ14_06495, partial [Rhabdochlamydiaceae bacterium]
GLESPIPLESQNPVPLGELGTAIQQKRLSQSAISKCLAVFEESSNDGKHEIERFRTFFTLMQSEAICCINFIPRDPHELQTIHVMRLQSNQDPKKVPVFCHANFFKYILPVERADHVFNLSKEKVFETVRSFTPILSSIIEKALGYFLKDRQAKGLALTFHEESGMQKTYVWLKGK